MFELNGRDLGPRATAGLAGALGKSILGNIASENGGEKLVHGSGRLRRN